jgi:4-aminobutyrate aminotransferase
MAVVQRFVARGARSTRRHRALHHRRQPRHNAARAATRTPSYTIASMKPRARISRPADLSAEGDVNLSPLRKRWEAENLSPATRELLAEDARYFLHQSLSTPCFNALASASGIWLEDIEGRRYMDFHGNSVHQVGHGHPRVVQAVKEALDTLPFSPRRFTNEAAI